MAMLVYSFKIPQLLHGQGNEYKFYSSIITMCHICLPFFLTHILELSSRIYSDRNLNYSGLNRQYFKTNQLRKQSTDGLKVENNPALNCFSQRPNIPALCIYVMHPVSQVGMRRQDGSFRLPMVTWGCVIVRCVQYVWVCRLWGAGMSHMSLFVWDVKCIIYINWRIGCHPTLFIYLRRLPWILSPPFFFWHSTPAAWDL